MSFIGSKEQLGVWALQDHRKGLDVGKRLVLAGARIIDPKDGDDPWRGFPVDDGEHKKGTVGDIYPWRFHPQASRDAGAWAQALVVRVVGRGNVTPSERATGARFGGSVTPGLRSSREPSVVKAEETTATTLPIRSDAYATDARYLRAANKVPEWLPKFPAGTLMLALAGTREEGQEDLAVCVDPRIIVVHNEGSAACSSLFCDLDPEDTIGEKWQARSHTALRVVRLNKIEKLGTGKSCGLALNLTMPGQEEIAGFGLLFGRMTSGAGATRPRGDITPAVGIVSSSDVPRVAGGPGAMPVDPAPRGPVNQPTVEAPKAIFGVGFLSREAGGPVHLGDGLDKHRHGRTQDGQPCNSAHLGVTEALFFLDRDRDAPLHFEESDYPNPPQYPLATRVHLVYDKGLRHSWMGEQIVGKWRWWSEAPMAVVPPRRPSPPTTPGDPPPGGPPVTPEDPPQEPQDPETPNTPTTPGDGDPGAPGEPDDPDHQVAPPYGYHDVRVPPRPRTPSDSPFGSGPLVDVAPPTDPDVLALGIQRWPQAQPSERSTVSVAVRARAPGTEEEPILEPYLQTGGWAHVWKAQLFLSDALDLRYSETPSAADVAAATDARPAVLRMEAWSAQRTRGFAYTEAPGSSRARGGTASGGVLLMSPEMDTMDAGTSFAPSGVTRSTSYFAAAPGVYFGVGLHHLVTGGIRSGVRWGVDSNGDLQFTAYDSLGVAITGGAKMRQSGGLQADEFLTLGGEATTNVRLIDAIEDSAAILEVRKGDGSGMAPARVSHLVIPEIAAEPAAVTGSVVLYVEDAGAGITRLRAKLPDGSKVTLASE